MRVTENRTNWPIDGGALSVIPGWNAGHPTSFFYINMGFGNTPPNMTNVISPVFQITGPSRDPFPGTFCFPDLPLPKNANVQIGDNATIQVIQVALHGASLYNVCCHPPPRHFEAQSLTSFISAQTSLLLRAEKKTRSPRACVKIRQQSATTSSIQPHRAVYDLSVFRALSPLPQSLLHWLHGYYDSTTTPLKISPLVNFIDHRTALAVV